MPNAQCPMPITNYQLPITHYQLPITNYPLPITHYPLPIPHYQFPITDEFLNSKYSDRVALFPTTAHILSVGVLVRAVLLALIGG
jgi:hypothetical protein